MQIAMWFASSWKSVFGTCESMLFKLDWDCFVKAFWTTTQTEGFKVTARAPPPTWCSIWSDNRLDHTLAPVNSQSPTCDWLHRPSDLFRLLISSRVSSRRLLPLWRASDEALVVLTSSSSPRERETREMMQEWARRLPKSVVNILQCGSSSIAGCVGECVWNKGGENLNFHLLVSVCVCVCMCKGRLECLGVWLCVVRWVFVVGPDCVSAFVCECLAAKWQNLPGLENSCCATSILKPKPKHFSSSFQTRVCFLHAKKKKTSSRGEVAQ